jgi:regulator of nucleoside diphosphate kinase
MNVREILVSERDRVTIEKRIGLLTGGENQDSWDSVRRLHEELGRAKVIGEAELPGDVVTMNSSVVLVDLNTGGTRLYTLVYPGYFADAPDRISVLTPLGTALLGSRAGSVIEYESTSGATRQWKLEDVVYQPPVAVSA